MKRIVQLPEHTHRMNKASLDEKFALIHEHWRPKVVAELNGQELQLVKFAGESELCYRRSGRALLASRPDFTCTASKTPSLSFPGRLSTI